MRKTQEGVVHICRTSELSSRAEHSNTINTHIVVPALNLFSEIYD
jgi:hypothetical protein